MLIGEVLGYGRSDALYILVTPVTSASEDGAKSDLPVLGQNYPNPFNGVTYIPYSLGNACRVKMALFNVLGQRVRAIFDEECGVASHLARVEMDALPSGSYWCRLEAGSRAQTVRLNLIK